MPRCRASCPVLPMRPTLKDLSSASSSSTRAASSTAAAQARAVLSELGEPRQQAVFGIAAVVGRAAHRGELAPATGRGRSAAAPADDRSGRADPSCRRETRRPGAGGRVARLRRQQDQQRRFELGIVEQLVTGAPPPLVERQQRRHFVVHLDARRQPGLDREGREDPLREGMQACRWRPRRAVRARRHSARGPRGQVSSARTRSSRRSRTRSRNSAAAFSVKVIAATLRIGDREIGPVGGDQLDDPIDEHGRLAGARAGLDEQGLVEARPHGLAGFAVGEECVAHTAPIRTR